MRVRHGARVRAAVSAAARGVAGVGQQEQSAESREAGAAQREGRAVGRSRAPTGGGRERCR